MITIERQAVPTIVIDTREQKPYSFTGNIQVLHSALPAGDYSISGHETTFAIERKSLDDWVSTIIHAKDRFRKECQRLQNYDRAYIVVEASWTDILAGIYKSKAEPESVMAISLMIMQEYQIPVILADDRPTAREIVERLCVQYLRRQERMQNRQEVMEL